jgi:hypothetical protein
MTLLSGVEDGDFLSWEYPLLPCTYFVVFGDIGVRGRICLQFPQGRTLYFAAFGGIGV